VIFTKKEEKEEPLILLQKFKELFNGTLGAWKGSALGIELKKEQILNMLEPFPIPKSREQQGKRNKSAMPIRGIEESQPFWMGDMSLHYSLEEWLNQIYF